MIVLYSSDHNGLYLPTELLTKNQLYIIHYLHGTLAVLVRYNQALGAGQPKILKKGG